MMTDAERSRRYRERNHEKVLSAKKAYYEKNKDAEALRGKEWRERNPDRDRVNRKRWKIAHPGAQRSSEDAWRKANPKKRAEYRRTRRAKIKGGDGKLSPGLADRLLTIQRRKCACGCNQSLDSGYHLDHIVPLALGGSNTDDNIQLLTPRCNRVKGAKHPVDFMQERGFLL